MNPRFAVLNAALLVAVVSTGAVAGAPQSSAPPVPAQPQTAAQFDGETYASQYASSVPGQRLVEYVRADESPENWTKLLAVRELPELADPVAAAAELARRLNESNPLARHRLLTKPDDSEALIDFLTWPEDGDYMEFNIFRYVKRTDAPGLVSYQFAYRFSDTSPEEMDRFKQQRLAWIQQMTTAEFPPPVGE